MEPSWIPIRPSSPACLPSPGKTRLTIPSIGRSTLPLLERLGLTHYFVEIVTFEHGFRPKPSGDGVAYLVRKYGLDKKQTAYVGDRSLDVLCAKDAGVAAILYCPEDSCVIPSGNEDLVIRHLTELTEM